MPTLEETQQGHQGMEVENTVEAFSDTQSFHTHGQISKSRVLERRAGRLVFSDTRLNFD